MQILHFTWYWKLIILTINLKNKNLLKYGQQSDFLNGLKSFKTVEGPFFKKKNFFKNDYAEHKMISPSINWYAGGFVKLAEGKSQTTIENSLIQKITSSYLPFHREKMGSHLLVETSRNPECPKVRFRRWSDSFFPHFLFWHWPVRLRLAVFSGVLLGKLLCLYLSSIPLQDKWKGNTL